MVEWEWSFVRETWFESVDSSKNFQGKDLKGIVVAESLDQTSCRKIHNWDSYEKEKEREDVVCDKGKKGYL